MTRAATAIGDIWEPLRADNYAVARFRIDARAATERYQNGVRMLFNILQNSTVASGVSFDAFPSGTAWFLYTSILPRQ